MKKRRADRKEAREFNNLATQISLLALKSPMATSHRTVFSAMLRVENSTRRERCTRYFAPRITRARSRLPISRGDLKKKTERGVTFVMDAVTVCATRTYSSLFLPFFPLSPSLFFFLFFLSFKSRTEPTVEQSLLRSILEEAVNVGAYASSDSRCDHRGSRFMIIKRHRPSLLFARSARQPTAFLKRISISQ